MQLGRGTIAVAALLVSVAVSYARAQSCAPLSSSAIQGVPRTDVCSSSVLVLPYSSVYVPAGASIDTLDTAFSATQIQLFLTFNPPTSCYNAAVFFACPAVYMNCTVSGSTLLPLPVCKSACDTFIEECASFIETLPAAYQPLVKQNMPNCTGINTVTGEPFAEAPNCIDLGLYYAALNDTHNALHAGTGGNSSGACPSPLIVNPGLNSTNCFGECCIPCPLVDAFYPAGWYNNVDTMGSVFGLISFFTTIISTLSYSVLPNKRGYPSHIILNISIALFFFYITIFFNFGPEGRNLVRCENYPENPVDLALPGSTHNPYTIAQGFFVIYAIITTVMWYGFLVLNIFMSVVFLSTRMGDYPVVYHLINWLVPWICVSIALAYNQFGFLGLGTYVTMNNGFWMDGVVMIPIAVIIFASVILNFITLARITLVGLRRKASYKQILRLQLRPFLFVLVILCIFLIYWIHYEVSLRVTPSDAFVSDWLTCILSGKSQDTCYWDISINYIPSFGAYLFAELVINLMGTILFIFFTVRRDVIYGWYFLIKEGTDASFFSATYMNGARSGSGRSSKP